MGSTPVQEFYKDKHVFLTGGTGFMGKVLVEKLLRSCHQLEKIYLLVREKKGKSTQERFDEIFDCVVFDRLKTEQPGFRSKVMLICGDCSKKKLDISEDNLDLLGSNVNIAFHIAAIVNFEASLPQSVRANLSATKEFVELACSFKALETFVFVSTAYSNGYRTDVKEKVYPPTMSPEDAISLCESMSEEKLAKIEPSLLEGWPNTYTFSKSLTENLLLHYKDRVPIAIVRPSQVTSLAHEPTPGWIGNYYGPTGIVSAAGMGLMRTFIMDRNLITDIIPCDIVVNLLIAVPCAWNRHTQVRQALQTWENGSSDEAKLELRNSEDQGLKVFNIVSGKRNPITYQEFLEKSIRYLYKDPPEKCLWSLIFITTTSIRLYKLLHILLHLTPGHMIDTYLTLAGKERRMIKIYKKIKRLTLVLKSFTMCQWNFDDTNVETLWHQMDARDQAIFPFNIQNVDWDEYVENNARGVRLYVLHDVHEHSQYAKRRYMMLRAANLMLWTSLTTVLVYGVSNLIPKSKL